MPDRCDAHREAQIREKLAESLRAYETERTTLIEHARTVTRYRDSVRQDAREEASAIVNAAASDIQKVLLRARRELLVIHVQLRAVGLALGPGESGDIFSVSELTTDGERSESPTDIPRELLRDLISEARSELAGLASAPPEVDMRVALERSGESRDRPGQEPPPTDVVDARPTERPRREPSWRRGLRWAAFVGGPAVALVLVVGAATPWIGRRSPRALPPARNAVSAPTARPLSSPASPAPAASVRPQPPASPVSPAGSAMSITVQRDVWMRLTIDGKSDTGRLYKAGTHFDVRATREVAIRAGDAGAVLLSYEGRKPLPLGKDGQTLTRQFTLSGAAADRTSTQVRGSEAKAVPAAVARPQPANATDPDPSAASSLAVGTNGPHERDGRLIPTPEAQRDLLARHQRWFDAFQRQDAAGMAAFASPQATFVDERRHPDTRNGSVWPTELRLEDVRVQFADAGAVISGTLVEHTSADTTSSTRSFLSEVWARSNGEWQLLGVRIVPDAGRQSRGTGPGNP